MPGSHRPDSPRTTRTSFTRRGKIIAAVATVAVVVGGTLGYFALFPQKAPAFVRTTLQSVGLASPTPQTPPACPRTGPPARAGPRTPRPAVGLAPPTPQTPPACPLTGLPAPHGQIPDRPALAIKVENAPEARPQASLNDADIVVEEPVEGGYTRFIAIFQCHGSDRVGPVRSGRTTDPDYLRQLGPAVFGYAGGRSVVKAQVPRVGLVDVNYILAAGAYIRDDSRAAPHNLFTATQALYKASRSTSGAPEPLFAYADAWDGAAKRVRSAHLPFSSASDVYWQWSGGKQAWLRSHGTVPHTLEDGERVSATDVVIQVVDVTDSSYLDAAGNPSPEVALTGDGPAYVLRDGELIRGRWERRSLKAVTRYVTKDGTKIKLEPGRTWVELVPSYVDITFAKH